MPTPACPYCGAPTTPYLLTPVHPLYRCGACGRVWALQHAACAAGGHMNNADIVHAVRDMADRLALAERALDYLTVGRIPIEDLACPVCGGVVKWSCHATGMAHCQNGKTVSRRWPGGDAPPCEWSGTPLVRVRNEVYALAPIRTDRFDEEEGNR